MSEVDASLLKKLETHRFQIPTGSAETLAKFRDELKEFMKDHPEIIGATVYGSQVKGTARPDSDVDTFLFVDEEKIGLPLESGKGVDDRESDIATHIDTTISRPFKSLWAKSSGLNEEDMKDVRFRILSQSRIDHDLQTMESYLEKMDKFNKNEGDRPSLDQRPIAPAVGRLFQLQLGRGLDTYRAYVLKSLEKKGELGDKIWETFFYQDILAEESGKLTRGTSDPVVEFHNKRKDLYPHSVSEAMQYYHLDSIKPRYDLNP
jgi:predicted nucleotidyltransferase